MLVALSCAAFPAACSDGAYRPGAAGGTGTITPAESRAWEWFPCGTIPADASDGPAILAAQFAPDGKTLALGWTDGRIQTYALPYVPLTPPRELRTAGPLLAFGFSRDGALLAEMGSDRAVTLRRISDGGVVGQLAATEPCAGPAAVAFSFAGDLLLAGACVWRLSDGALLGRLPPVSSAAFRDDGVVVATGCVTGPTGDPDGLCSYDLAGNEQSRQILSLSGWQLQAAPYAALGLGGDVVIWPAMDLETERASVIAWDTRGGNIRWITAAVDAVPSFAFSPDRDLVLFWQASQAGAVLGVFTGAPALAADREVVRHGPRALSPDGRLVVSSSGHGRSPTAPDQLFETETGASLRLFSRNKAQEPFTSLSISGDGALLAAMSHGSGVLGWRVAPAFASSEAIWQQYAAGEHFVDVSADGSLVAISGDVRAVFDGVDGRPKLSRGAADIGTETPTCIGGQMRFSPDGRFAVGKGYTSAIEVYDMATFTALPSIPTPACSQGIAFSRDGSLLATSQRSLFSVSDWSLRWQDAPIDGDVPAPLGSRERYPQRVDVELSPDGQRLLVTSCSVQDDPNGSLNDRYLCQTGWENGIYLGALDAGNPRISAEGHWIVSGGTLRHDPSGEVRVLDADATIGIFAPNGDVITGRPNGDLARYCRGIP